jgi:AbrB family looped-hinge helix DNA binding protein
MARTKLSSKGQIILPKSIRAAHNWEPGTEFIIEESDDGVLLKPVKPFKQTRLEDVLGCADYRGSVKTLEEMEEAIAKGATERI